MKLKLYAVCVVCAAFFSVIILTIGKGTVGNALMTTGVGGDYFIQEEFLGSEETYAKDDEIKNEMPNIPKLRSDCPRVRKRPSHAENLHKIQSYSFPGAEPYLSTLFARSSGPPSARDLPVFVTAVSSSHVKEAMLLLDNLNTVVRKKYPNIVLYLYDIGLTEDDTRQLKQKCLCTIRRFRFEDYPPHVKLLKGYAWKPIIVQLVAQEHPFIFWLDTSPRFKQGDLNFLFKRARKDGLLATQGFNSISSRTHRQTFEALSEDPCAYSKIVQMQACFIVLYITDFVRDYFLKPWVGCALSPACTVPSGDPYAYLECAPDANDDEFYLCHRFDQSVMNILMYRMYNTTFDNHVMKFGFYRVKRLGSNLE